MNRLSKIFLILFFAFLLVYSTIKALTTHGGDFIIYLGAAELLKSGQAIYNIWVPAGEGSAGQYSYSPLFAMLLVPFTYLPIKLVYLVWGYLNLFLLFRTLQIIRKILPLDSLSSKKELVFYLITIGFLLRFILYNFDTLQMTIVLVYCCLEGIYLIYNKRKPLLGAIFIAVGAVIKILPLVIIPYLFIRGKLGAGLKVITLIAVLLILPSVFVGFGSNFQLLSEWWEVINPQNPVFINNQTIHGEGIHSLSALIPTLLQETPSVYGIELRRNILDLDDLTVGNILNIVRMIFLLLILAFLTKPFFKPVYNPVNMFYEISYIMLITPLIFPHQQKYAFFFILPAVSYIAYFILASQYLKLKRNQIVNCLFGVAFILMVVTTDGIIGKSNYHLAQHYKLITYGAFFLILTLGLCSPKLMEKSQNSGKGSSKKYSF